MIKIKNPRIIVFNLEAHKEYVFSNSQFEFQFASLGKEIKFNNIQKGKGYSCLPNYSFPNNVHEFDIFVINTCDREMVDFDPKEHTRDKVVQNKNLYLFCGYPKNSLDTKPYGGNYLFPELKEVANRESILIVFSNKWKEIEYDIVNRSENTVEPERSLKYHSYSFYPDVPYNRNKYGKILNVAKNTFGLDNLLEKHKVDSEYHVLFFHPYIYDESNHGPDPNFTPLILNNDNEIVSFYYLNKKQHIFFFPDIKGKEEFIIELISEYLPNIVPEIFPNNSKHSWKNDPKYFLPNQKTLLNKKEEIEKKFSEEITKISGEIENNKKSYAFLHELLTESSDKLVGAVIKFLHYLEFENVINMDEIQFQQKEEDIQVILENGILIIEVKGIGGTSTDSDCSQISKIRYRRCEQRGKFDVEAIYLVNHQRHLPPHKRKNPPFSINQIQDAEMDKRGLLTTLELFKAFQMIESGLLSKKEVRDCFFMKGLINLQNKNLTYIGIVTEIFKNGTVGILKIGSEKVSLNENYIIEKEDIFKEIKIRSIMLNEKNVDEAFECEVGIQFSEKVTKNTKLYRKNK